MCLLGLFIWIWIFAITLYSIVLFGYYDYFCRRYQYSNKRSSALFNYFLLTSCQLVTSLINFDSITAFADSIQISPWEIHGTQAYIHK